LNLTAASLLIVIYYCQVVTLMLMVLFEVPDTVSLIALIVGFFSVSYAYYDLVSKTDGTHEQVNIADIGDMEIYE